MAKAKSILSEDGEIIEVEQPVVKQEVKKKRQPSEYVFQLLVNFRNPDGTLSFPPSFFLRNQSVVFDEETGRERATRYLEGISTIWQDEQDSLPENIQNRRPNIQFKDGFLRVPATKPTLVEFLLKNDQYEKKKNRMDKYSPATYTMINYEEAEEEQLKKSENKLEAMKIAMNSSEQEMLAHAKFLNVRFTYENGEPRSESAIRSDYVTKAQNNPDVFLKTVNNPVVKAKYMVTKAMENNLITIAHIKGQAHWRQTKLLIAQVPDGADAAKFLSEFALTEKGAEFYNKLKELS
jgi:hypothetical protein